MEIITDIEQLKCHFSDTPGSYEWWYFDLMDENKEYSCVIVFYFGFPFSPKYNKDYRKNKRYTAEDFPALTFCLYKKNKILINKHIIFNKYKFETFNESKSYRIKLDNNELYFTNDNGKIHIKIDLDIKTVRSKDFISAEFISTQILHYKTDLEKETNKCTHFWHPYSPKNNASIRIKKANQTSDIYFKGYSYHDHNWGTVPLFEDMNFWYWGRFLTDNFNGILYYTEPFLERCKKFNKLLLFNRDNELISKEMNYTFKIKTNYFFLKYPESIEGNTNNLSFKITNRNKLDNGPFYIRFLSDFRINYKGEITETKGITEFISPQRLKTRLLSPFINLKLKYYD